MTDVREAGLNVFRELMPGLLPDGEANFRSGGSTDELGIHFKIARTNGLSDDEIAEVIYHSSGYAGFPAASTACGIAHDALSE